MGKLRIVEANELERIKVGGEMVVVKTGLDEERVDVVVSGEVLKFKAKMLQWPNPVEYVNNMYGCHPDDRGSDYFEHVFGGVGE